MTRLSRWRAALRWTLCAALLGLTLTTLGTSETGATGLDRRPLTLSQTGRTVHSRDFPSIQAAIDSVRASGGAVYVPAGLHVVPAKVRLYSNVTLFGDGIDRTILRLADGVIDHLVSNNSLSTTSSNMVVRDLTLAGNGASTRDCCYGLRLSNIRDTFVINVAADGFSKDGIYLGYYRSLGVYNTRVSGCRVTNNGRNGIALTHGTGNAIDNCRVENNNRAEQVAGIDLEPDEGLEVANNMVVNNLANGQNVGIQLFLPYRGFATLANNAICGNTARGNRSAGIYDPKGNANIFVNNTTEGNGTNFLVDPSARVGGEFAGACQLSGLPARPSTPPAGSPPAPSPTPTATPSPTAPVACSPRPPVNLAATRTGDGRLQVTITAGAGSLQALRFGQATNARIDINGWQSNVAGNATFSPPAGTRQVTMYVRRVDRAAAATVPLVVVDGCGEWRTFVGGGPAAF